MDPHSQLWPGLGASHKCLACKAGILGTEVTVKVKVTSQLLRSKWTLALITMFINKLANFCTQNPGLTQIAWKWIIVANSVDIGADLWYCGWFSKYWGQTDPPNYWDQFKAYCSWFSKLLLIFHLIIVAYWQIIGADFIFILVDLKTIGVNFCNTQNANCNWKFYYKWMYLSIKHVQFSTKNITTYKIKSISKTKHFCCLSINPEILSPPPPSFPPLLPRINNIPM